MDISSERLEREVSECLDRLAAISADVKLGGDPSEGDEFAFRELSRSDVEGRLSPIPLSGKEFSSSESDSDGFPLTGFPVLGQFHRSHLLRPNIAAPLLQLKG